MNDCGDAYNAAAFFFYAGIAGAIASYWVGRATGRIIGWLDSSLGQQGPKMFTRALSHYARLRPGVNITLERKR